MSEQKTVALTFKEAIELGKYQAEFLAQFPEWSTYDSQIQYQFIMKALQNRRLQLRRQWAALANQLDFSKKPHLREAQVKVEQALHDLNDDEEAIIVEFAGK